MCQFRRKHFCQHQLVVHEVEAVVPSYDVNLRIEGDRTAVRQLERLLEGAREQAGHVPAVGAVRRPAVPGLDDKATIRLGAQNNRSSKRTSRPG